jgi:hypothetical protein
LLWSRAITRVKGSDDCTLQTQHITIIRYGTKYAGEWLLSCTEAKQRVYLHDR